MFTLQAALYLISIPNFCDNLIWVYTHGVFPAINVVYKDTQGAARHQVQVIDEVGPTSATNLCYVKGHYIDCNTDGEVAHSGKWVKCM